MPRSRIMIKGSATLFPPAAKEVLSFIVQGSTWWYAGGLIRTAQILTTFVLGLRDRTGFFISVRNLFTPMYQDYTPTGRIISLFFRLVFLLADLVTMAAGILVALLAFLLYLLLPPFIIANILHQLGIIKLL